MIWWLIIAMVAVRVTGIYDVPLTVIGGVTVVACVFKMAYILLRKD